MDRIHLIDATIVREHQDILMAYACRRLDQSDLAADLVQEVWAAAIQGAERLERRSAMRRWLMTILRHKIADHYRAPAEKRSRATFDESVLLVDDASLADWLDVASRARAIERLADALPERQRQVVGAICFEGRDRGEVARALGMTRSHVAVVLHRARRTLRAALSERR